MLPLESGSKFTLWLAEGMGFTALCFLTYGWSVGRAAAWGGQVKGAFDLYRRDLLKQLGYQYTPCSRSDEKALWLEISQQIIYGDPLTGSPYPYCAPPPQVQISADPSSIQLDVARGVSRPAADRTITVTFRVRNIDAKKSVASTVTISDLLPEGYVYVWDSAKVSEGSVTLISSSPPKFQLASVAPDKDLILTYSAISFADPKQSDKEKGEQSPKGNG